MTGLDRVWQLDDVGVVTHNPTRLNWGPKGACPVKVAAFPDGPNARSVALFSLTGDDAEVWLNPGAARWLGNRLIEAAVLAEQDASRVEYAVVTSDADQ